jgi:hypothetical protein
MIDKFNIARRHLPDIIDSFTVTRRLGLPSDGGRMYHIVGWSKTGEPVVIPAIAGGADGIYYRDRRTPFATADYGSVAPVTTMTALFPVGASAPCILPANYWYVGKTVKVTSNLKWTSGTAGNITFGMAYGAASAPPANVASTAIAAVASVGPFGVFAQGYATCRSIGTAGTLSMWGVMHPQIALILSTSQTNFVFPSGGVTVVSTIDTTVGTNAVFFQAIRSAGTDAVVPTDIIFEALN